MKNLLLTLGIAIYFSLLSGCKHQQEKPVSQAKIIGGSDAKVVYPFMAQLFQQGAFNELAPFCGGAVIDKHLVLTAAHCVKQGRKPWVSTGALASMAIQDLFAEDGDPNRKIRQVVGSLIHEEYKEGSIANDIALLLLSDDGPQNFSADQYINLATAAPAPNEKLRIMGWGNQTSVGQLPAEQLQELDTLVLSQDLCKTKHQEGSILPGMLCLGNSSGGADACKGDSGGPAVQLTAQGEAVLKGLASWGKGCGQPDMPTIYTDVYHYREWIESARKQLALIDQADKLSPNFIQAFCDDELTWGERIDVGDQGDLLIITRFVPGGIADVPLSTKARRNLPLWQERCRVKVPNEHHRDFVVDIKGRELTVSMVEGSPLLPDGGNGSFPEESEPVFAPGEKILPIALEQGFSLTCKNDKIAKRIGLDTRDFLESGYFLHEGQWYPIRPVSASEIAKVQEQIAREGVTCSLSGNSKDSPIHMDGKLQAHLRFVIDRPMKKGYVQISGDLVEKIYEFSWYEPIPEGGLEMDFNKTGDHMHQLSITNRTSQDLYSWSLLCDANFKLRLGSQTLSGISSRRPRSDAKGQEHEIDYTEFRFFWPRDGSIAQLPKGSGVGFVYEGPTTGGTGQPLTCFINSEWVKISFRE